MGDLNIDTQKNGADTNHYLSDLCDTFSLANLISSSTRFKSYFRILNCFSKVYEMFLLEKFKPFINSFLIRLIENCKKRSMKSF